MAKRSERAEERAVYIISVAAELAGVHPQTLRIYERKGLLRPARTAGNTRRYSDRDIARLRRIQQLTQRGVNLAGVKLIMELQAQVELARRELDQLSRELESARRRAGGDLVPMRRTWSARLRRPPHSRTSTSPPSTSCWPCLRGTPSWPASWLRQGWIVRASSAPWRRSGAASESPTRTPRTSTRPWSGTGATSPTWPVGGSSIL